MKVRDPFPLFSHNRVLGFDSLEQIICQIRAHFFPPFETLPFGAAFAGGAF